MFYVVSVVGKIEEGGLRLSEYLAQSLERQQVENV